MNAENEIKFIFDEYRKKSDKLLNTIENIKKLDLSENEKNKKINNINKKLRKLQDKYIRFLDIKPNNRKEQS